MLGAVILLTFPGICRAKEAAPGKWIHRTLSSVATNEANRRAKEIPPGRWWHLPYFANQLNITDQQKAQLDKLFDYNRNRLAELKRQVEEDRTELVEAIDRQHLDETSAIARMKKLESSRTLLAATRFTYSLEVRKLLGYERFERLKTLFRNWDGLRQYRSAGEVGNLGLRGANGPRSRPRGQKPPGRTGDLGLGKGRQCPRE